MSGRHHAKVWALINQAQEEDLRKRVQDAHRVFIEGDEAALIAHLLNKPLEDVRRAMGESEGPNA